MSKIWKLKYQNGVWVVLYHPKDGFSELTPDDLVNVFATKPSVEDMQTQIWADDLIERYLSAGDYSEANLLLEQFKLPK